MTNDDRPPMGRCVTISPGATPGTSSAWTPRRPQGRMGRRGARAGRATATEGVMKRYVWAALLALPLSLGLTGCGKAPAPQPEASGDRDTPRQGGDTETPPAGQDEKSPRAAGPDPA